ncbi:MAG: relaxase/mobilization nuclease domain-containing protein [Pseudomonadota bacterium]
MILVGNQRGGSRDLALHLMKEENEHAEVYELRGFASQNLMGALNEAYAVSRGTRCTQFLYSLSLNPPEQEAVPTEAFEEAIDRAEQRLGLTGQPRAIVFHEKNGRRHAHAVWSRIDVETMTARQMSFDHEKLQTLSRELFLEHEWQMPPGLAKRSLSDPRNFTLAEWQQARRAGKDARAVKTAIQDAWAISDSRAAFAHALEERGFRLARGDRRGFVAVDMRGEVYAIAKWTGVKIRQVRERLGDETGLLGVSETKQRIADDVLSKLDRFQEQLEGEERALRGKFEDRRQAFVRRQRAERQALTSKIEQRREREAIQRQERFRTGLKGLWDRMRGEHRRIRKLNEREAASALVRDRAELDALVLRQLEQRRHLNIFRLWARREHDAERQDIRRDVEVYRGLRNAEPDHPRSHQPRRNRGPAPER